MASALARAFFDDPVASFIFDQIDERAHVLRSFFALQLRHAYLPRGEVYTTDEQVAAALWIPPGARKLSLLHAVAHLKLIPMLGERLALTREIARLLGSLHPEQRHYYLGTIGTDPKEQGRGIGSRLVRPVLDRCDRTGTLAYLECSSEAHLGFYRSHGFEVTDSLGLPAGGPTLWLMRREPAGTIAHDDGRLTRRPTSVPRIANGLHLDAWSRGARDE